MGNNQSGPYSSHRLKKSVHYKSECPSPPGKPDIVPLGWAEDGVTLRWKPPRYDGGSNLTGYQVECNRLGSSVWVRTSPPLVLRPELLLTGLEPGFQYQFRVSACNAAGVSLPGDMSDILTVSIDKAPISAPKFVSDLQDSLVVEGEKVDFRIYFEGSPQPTISWFKDGYEIFSSRRTAIITEGNCSTLIFHQTSLNDEGEIKCTATNRAGHAAYRTKLSLEAAPRVRLPRNYEEGLLYETDETIFLKVSVAGKPSPEIEWRHNGQLIESSPRIEISTTEKFSTLRIENASRDDRGEYQINAINKIGEDYASFLVTITARPNPPQSVAVVQNVDKSVSLSWVSPNDDGGCQIGNYVIEYYRTGWNVWLKAATSRKLTATLFDLIEGSEYRFRIKAESPYGMSEPSEETRPIYVPGKTNDLKFNAMDLDFEHETTKNIELPQIVPRRKRNHSPRIEDLDKETENFSENANKYTLDIPTGVTMRKQRIIEKKETKVESKNLLRESNNINHHEMLSGEKMNNGSSEFMLVLYPQDDKENKEKRKSFQLDLEEAMSPPPLSLSAPDLGYNFIPIRPLRHSVSSTELLHERAMNRFYQVVAMKEAKQETNNIQTIKENVPEIKINIIKDDSISNDNYQVTTIPENVDEKENITPERNMDELVVSNESLSKDKSEDAGSLYEEDYTASTVSTGDSEISDSDSLGDDMDRLRSRIDENTTYHPKDMSVKVSPQVQSQPVEVLTKPAPLPDPNFVPKPILKKRETDIIPRVSPQKEIIPTEREIEKPAIVEEKEPKQKQSEKLLSKVPLFKKFAKFPIEKGVFSEKKPKPKIVTPEKKEEIDTKQENVVDTSQDEGNCVIQHYGDIVREFGQNKKPNVRLYTNTEELKKAVADQQKSQSNHKAIAVNNRQVKPRPPTSKVVMKKPNEPNIKKNVIPERKVVPVKQNSVTEQPKVKTVAPVVKNQPEIEKVSVSKSFSEINAEAENNVKSAINYVTDIFILCVAFWLYIFKDERLAIPFLILTMYRQVHSAVKNKIPLWLRNRISPGD